MYTMTLKDYEKQSFPEHFEIYNISDTKIEGMKDLKLLQLPKLHLLKFKKGQISKEELQEQYYRGLDSRGASLIGVDYGSCALMICQCENYKHSDTCPIPYLTKYMKKKIFEVEKYI